MSSFGSFKTREGDFPDFGLPLFARRRRPNAVP